MGIYLDNAATSFPKPKEVATAVYDFMVNNGTSSGRGSYKKAMQSDYIVYECRKLIGKLFNFDNPKKVVPLIRKSITLFFLTAANIPKGTAIINITINDIKANFKVGTNFNNIISITGFFVEYEIPKSPLKQELNQFQY